MKFIKSLLLVAAAMFTTATYAQVDKTFSFVDKNGKEIPNGSVWTTNDGEDNGFGTVAVHSGVYVKNNSNERAAAGVALTITKADNGKFKVCYAGTCSEIVNALNGTNIRVDNFTEAFKAGEVKDLDAAWLSDADGVCEVKVKLEYYEIVEGKFGFDSFILVDEEDLPNPMPSITILYVNGVTAINGVKDGENVEVAAIYDATGKQIQTTQKGLNIVKLTNGKTVKIVK